MIAELVYTALTSIIIVLMRVRKRVGRNWEFRTERDSRLVRAKNLDVRNYESAVAQPYIYNQLECCDCGLTHGLYVDEEGFLRTVPWRPRYRYKLRMGR